MAAAVFIAERNASPLEPSPHRAWTQADAGEAVFAGITMPSEDAWLLLLGKADTVLVMPITAAEYAAMSERAPGEAVTVTPKGRLAPTARQR